MHTANTRRGRDQMQVSQLYDVHLLNEVPNQSISVNVYDARLIVNTQKNLVEGITDAYSTWNVSVER